MLVELLLGLIVVISVLILWKLFSGGKEGNTINLLEVVMTGSRIDFLFP